MHFFLARRDVLRYMQDNLIFTLVFFSLQKLEISDDERCAEFCLKNESLNQYNCEPLEDILKRVQFEKIDLEATSLDDEVCVYNSHRSSHFATFATDNNLMYILQSCLS